MMDHTARLKLLLADMPVDNDSVPHHFRHSRIIAVSRYSETGRVTAIHRRKLGVLHHYH